MSTGDVAARRICRQILPTSLLGTQYTHTDTTCCHITDGHNYHFLTSFLTYNFS